MFVDLEIKIPAIKIGKFLLKKKLGLRGLLDVIPLDASLVKGSHGRDNVEAGEQPIVVAPQDSFAESECHAQDVYGVIKSLVLGASKDSV